MKKEGKIEKAEGHLRLYIEELVLMYMLWSDISGFTGVIPPDFEYIDKLIAWVVLALLLYHLSLTRILFGHKNPKEDLLIVLSFFFLVIKNNLYIIKLFAPESHLFTPYFKFMLKHAIAIEEGAFVLGGLLLIFLSFYTAKRLSIRKPSIMHLIHEEGLPPKKTSVLFARSITVFLVLIAFFIAVFNLFIELIGYLHDDSITILSIILGIVVINKHSKRLSDYKIFKKINDFSEVFLDKVLEAFKSSRHIFVALSGILVLHLLTDFIVFIMPLFLGRKFVSYLGGLETHNSTIFKLAAADIAAGSLLDKINILYLYSMEFIAILFLMIFPLYIWYLYYSGKEMKLNDYLLSLFFASLVVFLLAPIFNITSISKGYVLGVDIRIDPLSFKAIVDIQYIVMASLLVFMMAFLAVHYFDYARKLLVYAAFLPIAVFMIRYVFLFLKDFVIFYLKSINIFLVNNQFFFALYFVLFLVITVAFYLLGTSYFLLEAERKLGYFAQHLYLQTKKGKTNKQ